MVKLHLLVFLIFFIKINSTPSHSIKYNPQNEISMIDNELTYYRFKEKYLKKEEKTKAYVSKEFFENQDLFDKNMKMISKNMTKSNFIQISVLNKSIYVFGYLKSNHRRGLERASQTIYNLTLYYKNVSQISPNSSQSLQMVYIPLYLLFDISNDRIQDDKIENLIVNSGFSSHLVRSIVCVIMIKLLVGLLMILFVYFSEEMGKTEDQGKDESKLPLFGMIIGYLSLRIIYFLIHSITATNDWIKEERFILIIYHFSSGIFYSSFFYFYLKSLNVNVHITRFGPVIMCLIQFCVSSYVLIQLSFNPFVENPQQIIQVRFYFH